MKKFGFQFHSDSNLLRRFIFKFRRSEFASENWNLYLKMTNLNFETWVCRSIYYMNLHLNLRTRT